MPTTTTTAVRRRPRRAGGPGSALAVSLLLLVSACSGGKEEKTTVPAPGARSVILINGDGMSAAHREAARLDQKGFDGELAMDALPVAGMQTTAPSDPEQTITDSAAAASAWATGQKTYNGAISVDVDGDPLPTIGTEAREAGLATGLVTTADVTDATPAAFFSNSTDRGKQDDIARQYLEESKPSVILGGGAQRWQPTDSDGGGTARGLIGQAEQAGYEVVTDPDDLADADGDQLLGLFAAGALYQQGDEGNGGGYDEPVVPLADMTAKALDILSGDKDGFFLLVEEEGVDSLSHDNDGAGMLSAMRSLDAAVKVARTFVAENPDTLLIVTGDHDSGGLTIENVDDGDAGYPIADSDRMFDLDWTTGGHTGAPTPVTAQGPGSEQLTGFYPNTHLHEVLHAALID